MVRLLTLAVAAVALALAVEGLILSIDVGSDSMKIALVKPGLPFHIVTNSQSKRKTPVAITFQDGERFFGADSLGLQTRRPEYTFVGVHRLLGRNATHEVAQGFLAEDQYVAYGVEANSRGGFDVFYPTPTPAAAADEDAAAPSKSFKFPSKFSVEEVVAMVIAHGKEFSEVVAEGKIKDAVFMVPSFYTQNERLALIDAAELAGLNVLSLVDENFAAGVRYSIDNTYNDTTNVLVYNMGNAHTQVNIHSHSSYVLRDAGVNRTFSQFKVAGKGWSFDLGGSQFDDVLIAKFASAFNAGGQLKGCKDGNDVTKMPKAMAKLRKTVQRVKEILSVNDEYPVVVESLANDKDFKMNVKRTDLELWAADVLSHVTDPVERALADAGMTKADIHAVEVIGGGVRMPKVQALLSAYFAPLTLGLHLNGDEAMALGGGFVAANRSSAYRVKKIGAVDISPFSVSVNITSNSNEDAAPITEPAAAAAPNDDPNAEADEATTADETSSSTSKVWAKHSQIFPKHSALGTVKKIAFRHAHDISAVLFHDNVAAQPLPKGSSEVLAVLNITGVEDVVKGPKGHLGTPKIVLSFMLDNNGVYGLKSAEATLEELVEVPVATPKPKPSAAAPKKKTKPTTSKAKNGTAEEAPVNGTEEASPSVEATEEATPAPAAAVNTTDAEAAAADAGNATATLKTVLKKFIRRFPLKVAVDTSSLSVQPMSHKDKAAARLTLKRIQQLDDERHAREAAKNAVEAFIYASRAKLDTEAVDIAKVSTDEAKEALTSALMDAEDWLYDDGASTTLAAYKAKLADLKAVADVIFVPLFVLQNPTPIATPTPAAANATAAAANATSSASNSTEPIDTEADAEADAEAEAEPAAAAADAVDDAEL